MGRIKDLLSQGKQAQGETEHPIGYTPDGAAVLEVPVAEPPPVVVTQGTEHLPADQETKQTRVELADEGLTFGEYLVSVFGQSSDGGRRVTPAEWKQIGKRASRFGVRILVDLLR